MSAARQRAEWFRVGVAVSWIVNRNGWNRSPLDPTTVIPAPFRAPVGPERPKPPEQVADESRMAWHVLDTVFGRK